ncbi:MAG: PD-(D/E)XK nuclease family protein [Actinomycetes bacterium]
MSDKSLRVDVVQQPGASVPRRVSYSQMSLYQQCGLKFYFSYLGGWRESPTAALATGSIAHEVIEQIYRLPAQERTLETAIELLREHGGRMMRKPEYKPFESNNAVKVQIREAVENLFRLEDPVHVVVLPEHLEMELTVDINGVNFFGKVDRFTTDGINRVTDYKTGKSPGRYIDDKLAQPYLYALAFKTQLDIDIDEVELIFLNAQEIVRRPTDQAIMISMGEKLAVMHADSKQDVINSSWDARVQWLCDYCAFEKVCPARNPDAPVPGSPESDIVLLELGLSQR